MIGPMMPPLPDNAHKPSSNPSADIDGFNRLKDCRHGRMLYNVNDQFVGRAFDLYGEWSEGEVEVFRQIIRPGDVVIDVGANIGARTIFFARAVTEAGQMWAIEPHRLAFQTLCANVALNSLTNVWCMQAAAADVPGAVRVPHLNPRRPQNFAGLSLDQDRLGEQVQVIRLDSLPLSRCRLIKADVEGMERQALIGAAGLIEKFKPVLYVESDREEFHADLIRHIASIGYRAYWHRPPLFNSANFLRNPRNVFGTIVSINLLCVPTSQPAVIQGLKPVE